MQYLDFTTDGLSGGSVAAIVILSLLLLVAIGAGLIMRQQ